MFNSVIGRVVYRFLEVFCVAGAVALVNDPEFAALVGPAIVGFVVAVLKATREAKKL